MATITLTTTGAQDVRIAAAFGNGLLGLGRDATGPEVKAAIVGFVRDTVRSYESVAVVNAAIAGITPVTPT